ncbi:MAG: CtsR family transcriptional regulator [Clostridiales bacterium]|nr:CtsR family transcriptional regulator [Clostridiales bacterium]
MLISDVIAQMIEELLEAQGGTLEIGRNELASRVGCVPSQINYVITSRFTPEKGYVIESRRGGGGYLRIIKKDVTDDKHLMHVFASIGQSIDEGSARAILGSLHENGILHDREYAMAVSALSSAALVNVPVSYKNMIRADIFRQILMSLMK